MWYKRLRLNNHLEGGGMHRILVALICLIFAGCSSATLKTFTDPSINPESIKSVAMFPMRNAQLLPDETREINRAISQTFSQKNQNIKLVSPANAIDLMNQHGLTETYSNFLRDYSTSGIPNIDVLRKIGASLKVDAILQGEIFNIRQLDSDGWSYASTSLTIRYVLLSTINGNALWEGVSNGRKMGGVFDYVAPPLYEVILLAHEKILSALPTLGK